MSCDFASFMKCSAIRLISLSGRRIDRLDLDFGKVARNLRLELATDGMNPYGNLTTQHNSYPVLDESKKHDVVDDDIEPKIARK